MLVYTKCIHLPYELQSKRHEKLRGEFRNSKKRKGKGWVVVAFLKERQPFFLKKLRGHKVKMVVDFCDYFWVSNKHFV